MSYVIAAPEMMTSTATDLATIGSALDAAHVAAAPTLAVTPAAADEVSVGIAHLFSQHALGYQALAMKAAGFQEQFVENLKTSAASYTNIEGAIASLLESVRLRIDNFQYHLSEIPYVLANLDEFVPYVLGQLVLAPIVLGILALAVALTAVQTLIEIITSLLGSV